jgi:hypothetical protein
MSKLNEALEPGKHKETDISLRAAQERTRTKGIHEQVKSRRTEDVIRGRVTNMEVRSQTEQKQAQPRLLIGQQAKAQAQLACVDAVEYESWFMQMRAF